MMPKKKGKTTFLDNEKEDKEENWREEIKATTKRSRILCVWFLLFMLIRMLPKKKKGKKNDDDNEKEDKEENFTA